MPTTSWRSWSRHLVRNLATGQSISPAALARLQPRWPSASAMSLDSMRPRPCSKRRATSLVVRASKTSNGAGDVYQTPFSDGSFDVVTCRFAFHHLEKPAFAFAEMVRLAAPGGRIVLCDVYASDHPAKAAALNAMDRIRDPSTAEHRPLIYLRRLFEATGLGEPKIRLSEVSCLAPDFVARSFPLNDDRAGLLAIIEASVDGDTMDTGAHWTPEGVRFVFRSAVLSAVKPG